MPAIPSVPSLLGLLALCCILSSPPAAATAPSPGWHGYWTGAMEFRGDRWPMRLGLQADAAEGRLDLPELWMAWEPVAVAADGPRVTVALPFGLGDVALAPCGPALCGARALGGDTLSIVLERGTEPRIARTPVVLRSGIATLHGEFLRPAGEALPAVVLVHGSANSVRTDWNYRSAADFWLRRGHAVLLYDKRGSGASTGAWMTTSFPDLADLGADLRVALDWVAAQPGIDPARVGVHGGSQALWTVAIASGLGAPPAFAVLSGAPATTPVVQERDSVLRRLAGADLPADALAHARRHVESYFAAAADPGQVPAAIASSAAASGTAWADRVPKARTMDDFYWWHRNHGYDPEPALRAWDRPVLLLYGGADIVVAPHLHLPRMRTLLDPGRLTVATFPGAAHNLELPGGEDASGRWRFSRRDPGVAAAIDAWLATLPAPGAG